MLSHQSAAALQTNPGFRRVYFRDMLYGDMLKGSSTFWGILESRYSKLIQCSGDTGAL